MNVRLALWYARNFLRGVMPWVSRKKFGRLSREHSALLEVLACTPRASCARIRTLKAPERAVQHEVCLFVTHADRPVLKRFVVEHIVQLLDAGIEVVVVANTQIDDNPFSIEPALLQRLLAAYVRENVGFDFAAWSHARALSLGGQEVERLYLVNDSMAGPLDSGAFRAIIQRVRDSSADVIGLTDNTLPRPHLQSYFLVFSRRAQQAAVWQAIFTNALAFASKEHVIGVYEIQVTALLERAGLSTLCLFPQCDPDPRHTSDVHFRWRQLVERGLPFIKTSVVRSHADDPAVVALVPEAYRRDLNLPQNPVVGRSTSHKS